MATNANKKVMCAHSERHNNINETEVICKLRCQNLLIVQKRIKKQIIPARLQIFILHKFYASKAKNRLIMVENPDMGNSNTRNKEHNGDDSEHNKVRSTDQCINNSTSDNDQKNQGSEQSKIECNYQSPIIRLLKPECQGIRERVELLGELITIKKLDSVPDVYDEMAHIIAATERNERLQAGPDGKRLLELTTAAKSNLNVDLNKLDIELQRQFGLYSVEVTGDGACAFRATLISGMQKPDFYQSEVREKAIRQVLSDIPYYSTVLRPGDKVSEKELINWAQTMDDPTTYGDEMANIAVADRYRIQLVIFRAGELITVVNPRDGHVKHTAFLVNVGTHYKALVTWYELEEARRNSERLQK
ncbi:unnamed protein product [Rotaria sordida]|uniref:OTU domain-containing protein n=3 Tax=Rotaria sordida TaxID=392033 RepID=A0A814FMR8_9BILA|nr:unnamed protein product [Rotaria sordida]